ncbi:hypothetical protein [Azohydromonas caseinilytica]|uniref:Uncharacterized protein n=1 Tax=Azohydromonas caseinilytica TaxID=2728836 RepID=A0A848FF52_9BURK|nr:hypothetical protein [Azohydromonas caseinilytica]NML16531.1 hypothetical protein [Azohydromonas caseinilytica]
MDYDSEAIADFLEEVEHEGHPKVYVSMKNGLAAIGTLPDSWQALREHEDVVDAVRQLWQPVAHRLPMTLAALQRKLAGLAFLVTDSARPSLLYLFDEGRDLMARRGFWPLDKLPAPGDELDTDLSRLYRIHDGWVNIFGAIGGPLPAQQWTVIGKAPGIKGFLQVYSNGSQSLGFDLDETPAKAFAMDTEDDTVEPVDEFWAELDDRLARALKAYPDAR